jgi:outer membrane immunogenic protein
MMRRFLLVSVGLAAMAAASSAGAADLPRQMPVKAPAYIAPYFSWTGLYLGINGGYGWANSNWDGIPTGTFDPRGGLVGGTIGYNWQIGTWVWGLEGDADWSNIKATTTVNCPAGCQTSNTWLSTVRGRVGYAADHWLPYITGGAAFGDIKATTPGFGGSDTTNLGWTVGAGLEYAFAGPWTAKIEYLYVDLGSTNCGLACGPTTTDNVNFRTNIVRGGINFRF